MLIGRLRGRGEVPVGTVSELVFELPVPRQQVTRARLDGA